MKICLEGKTAVVFGGSRGIGKAIAFELAKAGAIVYIGNRQEKNAKQTCDELIAAGYKAFYGAVEITDYEKVDKFVARARQETGRIDIVVNNAGITSTTPYLDTTDDEAKRLMDINVLGVDHGCKAALKHMIEAGIPGKIVNIASVAGRNAGGMMIHYSVSKAAIIHLTKCTAHFGAPYNINVNAVCPGIVRTDMWEQILDGITPTGTDREAVWDSMKGSIPLARGFQTAEDIAYATAFFCSEYADQITGQSLSVDGGSAMV